MTLQLHGRGRRVLEAHRSAEQRSAASKATWPRRRAAARANVIEGERVTVQPSPLVVLDAYGGAYRTTTRPRIKTSRATPAQASPVSDTRS